MDPNAPAAKRLRLDRKCKENRLESSSSSSKSVIKGYLKRKISKAINNTANQIKLEPSSAESDETIIPKTKTQPFKITDLNAHCLLEVMQCLNLVDLCAMAEVCVDLIEIALKSFTIKYGNKICLSQLTVPRIQTCSKLQVRQLLHNFGHLIRSLTIDLIQLNKNRFKQLFSLIRNYCNETIEEVVILNEPKFNYYYNKYMNFIDRIHFILYFSQEIYESKVILRNRQQYRHKIKN